MEDDNNQQFIFQNENIDLYDYEEYYIIKGNFVYKIVIEKRKNDLTIKYRNYIVKLNKNNLKINHYSFSSIEKAYIFFINFFDENKVFIESIIINKLIKLIIRIDDTQNNNIELDLIYDKHQNTNYYKNLVKKNFELEKNINILKEEIHNLNNEIKQLKDHNNNISNFQFFSQITQDSYSNATLDNSFAVFKSINDILCLIYANQDKSIICYDLKCLKKISEIKSHHKGNINNFRHYLDKKNKRDLVLSLSNKDNNLKIWNANNWECILDIPKVYDEGNLFSSCLLNINEEFYIITSNCNLSGDSEPIKIFDFKGNKIASIDGSDEKTCFIDVYYDIKTSKNYIITGNANYVKSYDYNTKKLYHTYFESKNEGHQSLLIYNDKDNIIKLIESSFGIIRIWDFHSAKLLNKLKINDYDLRGICLWNNDYLLVGSYDKSIKVINLKKMIIVRSLKSHDNYVITIKKIFHPLYGECLISQGWKTDQIRMWSSNNL